jgi:hypothetical protein
MKRSGPMQSGEQTAEPYCSRRHLGDAGLPSRAIEEAEQRQETGCLGMEGT